MKTCKDCRKFDTPRCLFCGTARGTWRGCNRFEMMPNELQKAQWWFVGWRRRYWKSGCGLKVINRANTADHRLYHAVTQQAKEVNK